VNTVTLAALIGVLATAVAAYLIGRHRAVRGTLAWKRGHDFGRRAGLRERDELNARLVRVRQENDQLRRQTVAIAATSQKLVSTIRRHGPAELYDQERSGS
jgi:hypothetical protein